MNLENVMLGDSATKDHIVYAFIYIKWNKVFLK